MAPSPEALAITCPPSLLLLNSTLHHLTTPLTLTSADDPFLTTNMAGGTGEGIFSEVSVQRRTQPFPQGTSVSNISCLLSAKTAISEKGNTEEDAGLGSGHLQRSHIHPLQGNNDRMCCFMFQAASGQFPMNILTR